MSLLTVILAIAATLALAAMIPGPSFILVARTSLAVSRRDGISVAIGMGVGGAFFSALALVGLLALLAAVPWLYLALKVLGGCYLIYMGIGMVMPPFCTGIRSRVTRPWPTAAWV